MEITEDDVVIKTEDEIGIFENEEESFVRMATAYNYEEDAPIDLKPFMNPVTNSKKDTEHIFVENLQKSPLLSIQEDTQKKLLIYTKKIDDMRVWNCFDRLRDTKDILKTIIVESKPVFSGKYKKRTKRKSIAKFNKFKQKLDHYNFTVLHKSKCMNKSETVIHTKNIDDQDNIMPAYAVNTRTSGNKIILSKEIIQSIRYIIVFQWMRLDLADVYMVNHEGNPTEYHKIKKSGLHSVISHFEYTDNILLDYCCWYRLNKQLKYLKLVNGKKMLYNFMRRPHDCYTGNCVCCCKTKHIDVCKKEAPMSVHQTARNHLRNRWNQQLFLERGYQTQTNLINAALLYEPKTKNRKNQNKKQESIVPCSDHCIKLKNIPSLGQTFACYIGHDGLLNICFKSKFSHAMQSFISSCFPISDKDICCLTNYKKYCSHLAKQAHATVVSFLVHSNINLIEKCLNCESLEIHNISKGIVFPVHVPKYPRHTRVNTKIICTRYITGNKQNIAQSNSIENKPINDLTPTTVKNTSTHTLIDLGLDNLNLIISPNGKVTLKSKILPDNISTENLKIIREIIYHANKTVEYFAFNPTKSISVRNLFVKSSSKQNILTTGTQQPPNEHARVKVDIISTQTKNVQPVPKPIIEENKKPVIEKNKTIAKAPDIISPYCNQNIYESLKKINATKRLHYMKSHEFLMKTNKNLWELANIQQKVNDKDEAELEAATAVCNYTNETNCKRKSLEKEPSLPPKQQRMAAINFIHSTDSVPSTSLPAVYVMPTISTSTLQDEHLQNAPVVLPLGENVTLMPIVQLPQNLVMDDNKCAILPTQPESVHTQDQNPIETSQQGFNLSSLISLPMSMKTSSAGNSVPKLENSQPTNNESALIIEDEANEDDCIFISEIK